MQQIEIHQYVEQKKYILYHFYRFISNESSIEEDYQNLVNIFIDQKIKNKPKELQEILYFILKISNNRNRSTSFFSKIESIISYFKDDIKKYFTNSQIFTIFKSNKRILLYLIEEKILILDNTIVIAISKGKFAKENYQSYFFPEIKSFLQEEKIACFCQIINFDKFNENRKIGENDSYICQMIRNDLIDEFISYVNQNCISLNSLIEKSVFETNSLLNKNECSLIEYSAFFGSVQIFKYLYFNGSTFKPSLWIYAVHGDNPEIIHFLQENYFELTDKMLIKMYIESIKCHHNDIAYYIEDNLFDNREDINETITAQSIKYYNYHCFPNNLYDIFYFEYLCRYNYITLVEILWKSFTLDVMSIIINKGTLNIAAKKGNIEIIQILLRNKKSEITNHFFKCSKLLKTVCLPSTAKCINNGAFKDCSLLKQIKIPSSITSIGKFAFKGCTSLYEVIIPPFVTSIGEYAFKDCSSLTEILIPQSVMKIGESCFCGCSSLEQVLISPYVSEIANNAFSGCSSIKYLSIPYSVTSIGDYAFSGCLSMKQISVPPSVISIGNYAFSVCSSLLEIEIPSSVVWIGDDAFRGCSSLSQISISPSVNLIGDDVFRGCSSITQIEIPSSVTSIGNFSFCGCKSLKQIQIPSSVISIGNDAFKDCKALRRISIPPTVLSIGNDAFKGCTGLRQISIPSMIESISHIGIREKAKVIRIDVEV